MALIFTNRFMARFGDSGKAAVEEVYAKYFPMLEDEGIRITYTRSRGVKGLADFRSRTVRLAALDRHTIAHELTHMVQHLKHTIPTGEQACDIFTCAMAAELCDPYLYVKTHGAPNEIIHRICREAIELRAKGLRNYILYTKNSLRNWRDLVDA